MVDRVTQPDPVLRGGGGQRTVADTRSSCYNLTPAISWDGVGGRNASYRTGWHSRSTEKIVALRITGLDGYC